MVERGKTGKEKDRVIGWLEGSSATKEEDKQVAVPEGEGRMEIGEEGVAYLILRI